MKYTAKDTETIVDVALNTSGSLTSLPALVAGLPVGRKVGFDQTPWDGREIREWGQSWTPDVRGVEIDAPDVIYNERALRKARFDSPREVVDKAADWGQDTLVNYNRARVTFALDYAEPFSVTVTLEKGTYYSFPSPDVLGFVLPSTHAFVGWTYLGDVVTGMMIDGDTIIEGRVERQPGANLLRESRWMTGYSLRRDRIGIYCGIYSSNLSSSTIDLSGDYAVVRNPAGRGYNAIMSAVPTVPTVTPAGTILVVSWIMRSSASCTLKSIGQASLNKIFIDGVRLDEGREVSIAGDMKPHLVEFIHTTIRDIPANYTDITDSNITLSSSFTLVETAGSGPLRYELPKIEDVTGLPEEEQRATAWVPHVDDPA